MGKEKRNNYFSKSLDSSSLRPTQTCQPRAGWIRTGPQRGFTSQSHPAPIVERGRLQLTSLPHSKAGRAWRGSARKLRWDSAGTLARRIGLGSLEDAALHWLELAGLTPPSARRWRPGTGNPYLRGAEAAGESFPCASTPRGCSRGGPGTRGPPKTCCSRDSPFVFTCRRDPERRSPCPPPAGRALSRLWRPGL